MRIQDIIGDWRFVERVVVLNVGVDKVQITTADPQRYSLVVSVVSGAFPADVLQMFTDPSWPLTPAAGIAVKPNEPLFLDMQHHGIMVNQPWYISSFNGLEYAITVYEVIQQAVLGSDHG